VILARMILDKITGCRRPASDGFVISTTPSPPPRRGKVLPV